MSRSLTDAQERALIDAANAERDQPGAWHPARDLEFGWKPGTWHILSEVNLVRVRYFGGAWCVQVTPAGLALCDSMGD